MMKFLFIITLFSISFINARASDCDGAQEGSLQQIICEAVQNGYINKGEYNCEWIAPGPKKEYCEGFRDGLAGKCAGISEEIKSDVCLAVHYAKNGTCSSTTMGNQRKLCDGFLNGKEKNCQGLEAGLQKYFCEAVANYVN